MDSLIFLQMSVVLRVPFETNQAAIRALEFAVDPTNSNIIYLPLGWTIEQKENMIFVFDKSATHRATYHDEILSVADDMKIATSTKVQLASATRALRERQNIINVLWERLEIYKYWYWQLLVRNKELKNQ